MAVLIWRGSNNALRREILDSVCLNRTLTDVSLVTTKRKPFDGLAERLKNENSRLHCQFFEPVIADFADAALQPPSYLRRLHELARECA